MEDIMKVELASCGNPDHFQDPNRPMYGCESKHHVTVKTLEEASIVCRKFIEENFLGGGNWAGGKVYENNKYIAQIYYNGKIMPPEPKPVSKKKNLSSTKKELVAIGTGDVPAWLEDDGLELAKAYFKDNHLNPYTCFEAILYENNAELQNHWGKAEKAANKILLSDSRYDNSIIILTFTKTDIKDGTL